MAITRRTEQAAGGAGPSNNPYLGQSIPTVVDETRPNTQSAGSSPAGPSTDNDLYDDPMEVSKPSVRPAIPIDAPSGAASTDTAAQAGLGAVPTIATELEELRAQVAAAEQNVEQERLWKRIQIARAEQEALRERRELIQAGDLSAAYTYQDQPRAAVTQSISVPKADLPKPKDPHVYKARDRQDFEKWKRDCEFYFLQNPYHFTDEVQKVAFGYRSIGETQKTSWDTYLYSELTINPQFVPTWAILQDKMLSQLGSPQERRNKAFEQLKGIKQKDTETPSEVLYQMEPLWIEVDEQSQTRKISEFTNALRNDIRRHLALLPEGRLVTLTEVETEANRAWRQRKEHKPPVKPEGSPKKAQDGQKGDKRTRNDPSNQNRAPKSTKPSKLGGFGGKKKKVTCYNCNKLGHYSDECTAPKATPKDSDSNQSENSKGQKS